jgi:hypothetical protein
MLNTTSRIRLLSRLHCARKPTHCSSIKPEFLFDRPISERHRLAFTSAISAFDWNLLSAIARLS